MTSLKFLLLFLLLVLSRAEYLQCPAHQRHFEKIVGYRPSTHYDMNMNFNLERNMGVIPEFQQLNTFCWSQCHQDINCFGYVYFLKNNTCFGYSVGRTFEDTYYIKHHKLLLLPDANAVFFQKMCLRVPGHCQQKMWPISRYPRALVMPQEYERSEKLMGRRECVESCIHESKFPCHSVLFIPSNRNNFIRSGNPSSINRNIGQCILSAVKSPLLNGTAPDEHSSSHFRLEYIENQCIDQWSNQDPSSSECSFEKYYNRTFIYADSSFNTSTLEDCQMLCLQEDSFSCRGISYISKTKKCFLHSDDIALFGEASLTHSYGSIYMRRVECLNVTVACMDDEMVVKYRPAGSFVGKLFLNSRYSNCSVQENRTSSINLKIPFGDEIQENLCGIVRAYERRDDVNRTLISTLIVIQNNRLARTYDDRMIKIGCVVNNSEILERASKEKILYPQLKPETKSQDKLFSNGRLKFVKIELIDLDRGIKVSELNLGQKVQLKILGDALSNKFTFRVVNLTAISDSGEEMLLLDQNGCPEDPSLMSIFSPGTEDGKFFLTTQFRAFKFFDSPRVIFKIFLQFCTRNCTQMNCNAMPEKEIGGQYVSQNNDTEVFDDLSSSPTHMDLMFPEIFHGYRGSSLTNATVEIDGENFLESSEVQYQRILASLDSDEDEDIANNASKIFKKYSNFYTLAMYDFLVYTEDARSESFVYGRDTSKDNSTNDPKTNTFMFEDLMCIDTTLLKILFTFFILLLIVILFVSYCCIRRHRKLAEYDSNSYGTSSSNERRYLPKFLQGHRHVKWADENYGFVY